MTPIPPTVEEVQRAWQRYEGRIRETPAWEWSGFRVDRLKPAGSRLFLKLELLQHTGTFKPRGALSVMLDLDREQLDRGVVGVSAGNHGMALAFAGQQLGSRATVVMPTTANPARIAACRALGAEVELLPDIAAAFARAEELERAGQTFVHPFEGPKTALGTATLGLEFLRQVGKLDALVVAIGGGGLAAGVAAVVKQLQPRCRVIGVEPEGADSMSRSLAAGSPQSIEAVRTIADSLGAPAAEPYSFALCRDHVDEIVRVSDDELCRATTLLFGDAKLAVEPAGAASTAAMLQCGDRLRDQRIGIIICGANVDPETHAECMRRGQDGIF